jgi:chromosomal replication initiation ATPase DnaA
MNSPRYRISDEELINLVEMKSSLKKLLEDVGEVNGYSVEQMKSKNRVYPLPYARSSFAVIAKEAYPSASSELIGSMVNKDHSTVIAMYKRVEEVREAQAYYQNTKEKLKKYKQN